MTDYSAFFSKMESMGRQNQRTFDNVKGIMYFDDTSYGKSDYNQQGCSDRFYDVVEEEPLQEDTFRKLRANVSQYIEMEKYSLEQKRDNLTECVLDNIKYTNIDAKNVFFKKMSKDYDVFNFYTKWNYRKIVKRDVMRTALYNKDDNDEFVRQMMADYLGINLIVFTNDEIRFYCKGLDYEIYRPTIYIYEHENSFYTMIKDDSGLFTSEDAQNFKIRQFFINKEVREFSTKEKVVKQNNLEKVVKTNVVSVNYNKMKVGELREFCDKHDFDYKVTKKGKKKNMTKKEMIAMLNTKKIPLTSNDVLEL